MTKKFVLYAAKRLIDQARQLNIVRQNAEPKPTEETLCLSARKEILRTYIAGSAGIAEKFLTPQSQPENIVRRSVTTKRC